MKKLSIVGIILSLIMGLCGAFIFVPQAMGYKSVFVLDSDMGKEVSKGSLCFLSPKEKELSEGDVIGIQKENGESVIRRVVKIKPLSGKIITKGDGKELIDENFLDEKNIVGILAFSIPILGFVKAFITPLWGKLVFFGAMILILALSIILLFSSTKNSSKKKRKTKPPKNNYYKEEKGNSNNFNFNFDD